MVENDLISMFLIYVQNMMMLKSKLKTNKKEHQNSGKVDGF